MRLLSSATAASSAADGDGGEAAAAAAPQLCSDAMVLMLLLLLGPPLSRGPVGPPAVTPLCGGEPSAAAPPLPFRSAAASAAIAVNGDRLSGSRGPARTAAAVGLKALRGETCRVSVSLPVGPGAAAGEGGWAPPNIRSPPSSAPLRSTPCLRPAPAPFAGLAHPGGSPFACFAACDTSAAVASVPAAGALNSNDFTRLGRAQRSASVPLDRWPPLASAPWAGGSRLGRFRSGFTSLSASSCESSHAMSNERRPPAAD